MLQQRADARQSDCKVTLQVLPQVHEVLEMIMRSLSCHRETNDRQAVMCVSKTKLRFKEEIYSHFKRELFDSLRLGKALDEICENHLFWTVTHQT